MFTKLFNGGEARLVLLENAEDPLECGIDIIARPRASVRRASRSSPAASAR